jgi:rRNA maturation RNase YbeY
MTSSPDIRFFFIDVKVYLPPRTRLKAVITQLFRREGRKLHSLNYIFCNDKKLLTINKAYLKHHSYTDIITFDLSNTQKEVIGEIYISIERVRENANLFNSTLKKELLRVIFHGALHLCDYADKTKHQQARMRQREDFYISAYLKNGR